MEQHTRSGLLRELGEALVTEGICRDSYPEALCAREDEYPTGLDMDGFGIAMPHSDAVHVIRTGLAIGVPRRPVTFTAMGTDDETVEARIVVALAIDDPGSHLDFVEALLEILRDREVLEAIEGARTPEEAIARVRMSEEARASGLRGN
jgi:PTS system galactitol-specific IIA component